MTGWSGAKLFHDHVINKPRNGSNGVIPAHQDSMFWPVNQIGISVLVALKDVTVEGGCLEVLDGSHIASGGRCNEPVDFMARERTFTELNPSLKQRSHSMARGAQLDG